MGGSRMLQSLHVHNFALLEDAHADFTRGFNVFTGETGAGKSILIDAFGLVLGGRASADYVRSGTDGLWVQAVFDITGQTKIQQLLQEQGLEADDDLFLKRQINAAGKSKALVNGVQVPLSVLKALGAQLVDIHGQHENQDLLKSDTPRLMADMFGGEGLAQAYEAYKSEYAEYVRLTRELEQLRKNSENQDLLRDRYAWEINEIERASLVVGEEEQLEAQAKVLQNSERIIKAANRAYSGLDSDDAVLSRLAGVREELHYAARLDEKLRPLSEAAESAWITLDDCRTELSEYLVSSEFSEEHANEVQERLDVIYRLQKKYGGSTEAVLEYLARTEEALRKLEHIAEAIEKARQALDASTRRLTSAARVLTNERLHSAKSLADKITTHIHDLAMPNGVFEISVTPLEKFTPVGADELHFRFSANMGEPVSDLEKVASGGELSRIALALKTVLMHKGSVGTMVFDEIDTGVGGVTALRMAEKIATLATVGQILCITHLPQIAAFADNQIHIEKLTKDGRTQTVLTALTYEARMQELVRMTAGASTSRAAYESAAELLQNAKAFKDRLIKAQTIAQSIKQEANQ